MRKLILSGSVMLLLASCTATKKYTIAGKSDTQTSGTITFKEEGKEVVMTVDANHLTPGDHAIHIHEKGDCSAPDAASAGGHWNPMKDMHGQLMMEHHHMGDIGNLVADANGNAHLVFKTDQWCLTCMDESKRIIGKAIIIHKNKDDFQTQPTGNAGGRIGCVEIK